MKRIAFVIVLLVMALALSGCVKDQFVKQEQPQIIKQEQPQIEKKQPEAEKPKNNEAEKPKKEKKKPVAYTRTMRIILQEILANGELIDKDIYAKRFGTYEYTWEMWIIKENTGDFHAAVIENGILISITPVDDLEDARRKFVPYGGWRDKK